MKRVCALAGSKIIDSLPFSFALSLGSEYVCLLDAEREDGEGRFDKEGPGRTSAAAAGERERSALVMTTASVWFLEKGFCLVTL